MLVREAPDSRGVPDRVRRGAGGCGSAFVQCGERHGGIGRGGSLPEIRAAAQEKREATHRLVPGRGNWVNIQKATPIRDRATRAKDRGAVSSSAAGTGYSLRRWPVVGGDVDGR